MAEANDYQERQGTYVGPLWQLKGKIAQVRCYPSGQVLARFGSDAPGYDAGFYTFNQNAFDLDKPVDWSGGEDLG